MKPPTAIRIGRRFASGRPLSPILDPMLRLLPPAILFCMAALVSGASAAPQEPLPAATGAPAAQSGTAAAVDSFVVDTGDVVRVSVFQSPDLLTETRVDESGAITLPLVGMVQVRGLTPREIENRIADALVRGKFLKQPQVTVAVLQFRSQQVSVLGNVNRPGRYPLDLRYTLSDMLAVAGGVTPNGADSAVLSRHENGRIVNRDIDLESMFAPAGDRAEDVVLQPGDAIYVRRAPMFYAHGEVQRPGSFRVERNMTIRQAIATAGGVTPRGTLRGVRVERRDESGRIVEFRPESLEEPVRPEDVIYVKESLF
jgi:polysaccharide export outer membrane protein